MTRRRARPDNSTCSASPCPMPASRAPARPRARRAPRGNRRGTADTAPRPADDPAAGAAAPASPDADDAGAETETRQDDSPSHPGTTDSRLAPAMNSLFGDEELPPPVVDANAAIAASGSPDGKPAAPRRSRKRGVTAAAIDEAVAATAAALPPGVHLGTRPGRSRAGTASSTARTTRRRSSRATVSKPMARIRCSRASASTAPSTRRSRWPSTCVTRSRCPRISAS